MVIKLLRLKQFKNIKGFLNLIRVAKIDGILNVKANTNKKIEQILEKFEKKKKLQNLLYKPFLKTAKYKLLPGTNS